MVLWIMRAMRENLFWVLGNIRSPHSAETIPPFKTTDPMIDFEGRCHSTETWAAALHWDWVVLQLARELAGSFTTKLCQPGRQHNKPLKRHWHATMAKSCAAITTCSRAVTFGILWRAMIAWLEVRGWITFWLFGGRLVGLLESSTGRIFL